MTPTSALRTESLCRRFGARESLAQLDLEIPAGGVHALTGRNGAGKSTLLRIAVGHLAPSAGRCEVLGLDAANLPTAARGRIGYVAEGHPLPPWMSVEELVDFERTTRGRWHPATFAEIAAAFGLAAERRAGDLSRGERAGLALALALASEPELLLLDEPTAGLDAVASRAVLEALLFVGEHAARTVVFSSHRASEIERSAETLHLLAAGRLAWSGSPDDLRRSVSSWSMPAQAGALERAQALPGCLEAREVDGELLLWFFGSDPRSGFAAAGLPSPTRLPVGFERGFDALLQGAATLVPGGRST